MSYEFLDFVEDILDAMDKAEVLAEGFNYREFEEDFAPTLPSSEPWKSSVRPPSDSP